MFDLILDLFHLWLELIVGITFGSLMLFVTIHLCFPSFCSYLVLLCAVRSGKYSVRIDGEGGEQSIIVVSEEELRRSRKLRMEFYHDDPELWEEPNSSPR